MKNKFIKSTIILIIGGGITKILAMIIKIFLARSIGEEGNILYMSVLPTFNLFITISTLSLSTGISKLISERNNSQKTILSLVPISLLYNFILMFILILISPYIANNLLKNNLTYYPILAISFTLPFICLSTILKGYFFGKEHMTPYIISNIIEQIIRLIFIIFFLPNLLKYGLSIATMSVVLINVISELSSIICLIIFIPNKKINFKNFKLDKTILKDVLNISIPTTGSRLIGSISYFLEPIILTYIMTKTSNTNGSLITTYGIITGYVYPLLLIPSFFTSAISTALLPVISNNYAKKKYQYARHKLTQAIIISLAIGLFCTFIFITNSKLLLKFIFNTSLGNNYIKIIAPFFLLHYIQGPLTAFLQAIGKADIALMGTLIGSLIKNILLLILPIFLGIWGFIISSIINIFYVTIQHLYYTKKAFL